MRQATVRVQEFYPRAAHDNSNLQSLARAILAQAFWDALAPPRHKYEHFRDDALEWFSSSERSPGSFHWICTVLHIDSKPLRNWVHGHERDDRDTARQIRFLLRPTSF